MTKKRAPKRTAGARSGTYFLSLEVRNLRCFGPAQMLDLSDGHGKHSPWTLILGENGLGKTTLLTSLACLASLAGQWAFPDEKWRRDWPEAWLTLVRRDGMDGKARASVVSYNGSPRRNQLELRLPGNSSWAGGGHGVHAPAPNTYHYGASRRMPVAKGLAATDDRVTMFLDDDVSLRDPEDWLLNADYGARLDTAEAGRFKLHAEQVKSALIEVLPDVEDLKIIAPERPGSRASIEALTPFGWVPLRRLGFGYQSQIAWIVDVASRMFDAHPDSPDPLAEPAVILVDEIDLHMHPRWQRDILGFLTKRFPKTQFIVTAHSPLIVQAAADANIVLLRREGDHVVIDNDPERLRNWRVDQILTSELFGLESARPPQIEEPLKERRALLAKSRLTDRDRERLQVLEAEIGDLPAGETAEDRRTMELLRRATAKLQNRA